MNRWLKYGLIWNISLLILSMLWQLASIENQIDNALHGAYAPFSIGDRIHIFGTDYFGYDLLNHFISGFSLSVFNALVILVFSSIIALLLGVLAGYFANDGIRLRILSLFMLILLLVDIAYLFFIVPSPDILILFLPFIIVLTFISLDYRLWRTKYVFIPFDRIISSLYEIMGSLPKFILLICLVLFLEPNWLGYACILSVLTWVQKSRIIRAEVIKVKTAYYIDAAKALGIKDLWIIIRHILNNIQETILVTRIYAFGNLFLLDASLNFIGISGVGSNVSWGNILAQYRYDLSAWWLLLFPSIGLTLFLIPLFSLAKYLENKTN